MVAESGAGFIIRLEPPFRLGRMMEEIVHPHGGSEHTFHKIDFYVGLWKDVPVLAYKQVGGQFLFAVEEAPAGALGERP